MAGLDGFQLLCVDHDIVEKSRGIRFRVHYQDAYVPAFAIRYDGKVSAFLNRCAHQAIELDWNEGDFFDSDNRFLLCATHGAIYDPVNGHCVGGRCQGKGLTRLDTLEADGAVYIHSDKPLIK